MISLTVRIFPLIAVLISLYAFFFPYPLSELGNFIVPSLCIIMLGMGATLSISDFCRAAKNPKAVIIEMALQFGVMPLLAFCIAHMLSLPKEQLIGLVLVGAVAGGTASNVMSYIAGGDVALSITMTACSTIGGIFLTPILTSIYLGANVDVPVFAIFRSIIEVVAIPVAFGLVLNRYLSKRIIDTICPIVSVLGIIFVIGVIIAMNGSAIRQSGVLAFIAVVLHNSAGLALGYFVSKIFGCSKRTCVTIAIETGMQNSGLAVALAKQCFGAATALPAALFSIWHNISGSIFAGFSRRYIIVKKH